MPSKEYVETTLVPGLKERTYASGEVVYRSYVYFDGQQSLKTLVAQTRTDAKQEHRARQHAIDEGERPARALTLGELRDEAFAHFEKRAALGTVNGKKPRLQARALGNYRTAWDRRVSPYTVGGKSIDRLKLADFDRKIARAWLAWLAEQKIAPSSQNGTLTAIRTVLRYARDNDYMAHDPFNAVPTEERPSQKPRDTWTARVFTEHELDGLCETAASEAFVEATPDTLFTHVIVSLAYSGLRLSELAGLLWADVDMVSKVLTVSQQRALHKAGEEPTRKSPKSERGKRWLPMQDALEPLYEALLAQLDHEQAKGRGEAEHFVFTDGTGRPLTIEQIKSAVRRATRMAGLGEHGPQVLRRSFATALAQAGVASVQAEAWLGHSPEVFDDNYAKPLREAAQMAADLAKLSANRTKEAA